MGSVIAPACLIGAPSEPLVPGRGSATGMRFGVCLSRAAVSQRLELSTHRKGEFGPPRPYLRLGAFRVEQVVADWVTLDQGAFC